MQYLKVSVRKTLLLGLFQCCVVLCYSQNQNPVYIPRDTQALALYFENLEREQAEVIGSFEGFPSPVFIATDLKGEQHVLTDYEGHVIVLFFWSTHSQRSLDELPNLNQLAQKYDPNLVRILSFANDDHETLMWFMNRYYSGVEELQFPVIANSREFSKTHFGENLSLPKVFIIDKYLTVRKVYGLRSNTADQEDWLIQIQEKINDLVKE